MLFLQKASQCQVIFRRIYTNHAFYICEIVVISYPLVFCIIDKQYVKLFPLFFAILISLFILEKQMHLYYLNQKVKIVVYP